MTTTPNTKRPNSLVHLRREGAKLIWVIGTTCGHTWQVVTKQTLNHRNTGSFMCPECRGYRRVRPAEAPRRKCSVCGCYLNRLNETDCCHTCYGGFLPIEPPPRQRGYWEVMEHLPGDLDQLVLRSNEPRVWIKRALDYLRRRGAVKAERGPNGLYIYREVKL